MTDVPSQTMSVGQPSTKSWCMHDMHELARDDLGHKETSAFLGCPIREPVQVVGKKRATHLHEVARVRTPVCPISGAYRTISTAMPFLALPDYNHLHSGKYQIWYTQCIDLCIVAADTSLAQTHLMPNTCLVPHCLDTEKCPSTEEAMCS
jgi:hypothetical protein